MRGLDSAAPGADDSTMGIPAALRARDPRSAARSSTLILLVCAVVVAAWVPITGIEALSPAVLAVHGVVVIALVAGAVLCRQVTPEHYDRWGLGLGTAAGGVVLVCTLNLVTQDASAAAQAFYAFPVLWAGSHLRTTGILVVTAGALTGETTSVLTLKPAAEAVVDVVFFGAVLVVMAVMLVRARAVQDRLVAALEQQATVDALTGLVNRRVFDTALERTLSRPAGCGTALVLVDVDSFKTINDSYGHPVGDDVLVHLAGILRSHVRAEDAVLSRLGGDELAVLLPGSPAGAAARRAEELLQAVRSTPLPLPDGTLLSLSVSVGVAHVPPGSGGLRALYSAADGALYEAKRAGRGRVAVAA